MLFRTVYGPELEAIYRFIYESGAARERISRESVHNAFVPRNEDGSLRSTQNVDDALLFLRSAGMIQDHKGFHVTREDQTLSFRLRLLRALRRIERGEQPASHPIDPLYTLLLDELFIKPDCLFVPDVHTRANELRQVKELGGLSREKTQAWQRVMSFLGAGRRVAGGFQCAYTADLVMDVAGCWTECQGTLQAFFEEHLGAYLPFARQSDGDLAIAVRAPLDYSANRQDLELFSLQDSPSRPYFGERRFRGIRVCTRGDDGN